MVFSAIDANVFTTNAITIQSNNDLQREIDLTERTIRNAATRQLFTVAYDARIIGNPFKDPQDDDALTALQISYRDALVDAGYLVTLHAETGFWGISWDETGVESLVSVYSIRTTVLPGAISAQTIVTIDTFFEALFPTVSSTTSLLDVGPGSDTDEGDFGATDSEFYEYIAVVRQQDQTLDHSTALRTALTQSGLGYDSAPTNVFVYKVS